MPSCPARPWRGFRALLWKSRKQAFGAIGRLSPSFCTQDGVVPRTKIPHITSYIQEVAKKHDLRIVNVYHAGDGNIHASILMERGDEEERARAERAVEAVFRRALELGGTLSAEHGIAMTKRPFLHLELGPAAVAAQMAIKRALDPGGILNPGKVLPD